MNLESLLVSVFCLLFYLCNSKNWSSKSWWLPVHVLLPFVSVSHSMNSKKSALEIQQRMENKWTWTCSPLGFWRTWFYSSLKKPSLPLTSEEKKLQYRFKPTWVSFQRKRPNLGSSKPHTHYQLPNLNNKRKRFSQHTGIADLELKASLLLEGFACAAPKIIAHHPTHETQFGNLCYFIHCHFQPLWIYALIYRKVSQTHTTQTNWWPQLSRFEACYPEAKKSHQRSLNWTQPFHSQTHHQNCLKISKISLTQWVERNWFWS